VEIELGPGERAEGGVCRCGARFFSDPTGKNVGEVMLQGLRAAAGDMAKEVMDLIAGEDYDDAILSYDWRTHHSPGESEGFMDGYGRLYIIRVRRPASASSGS
jgi:hypothetical protein